MVLVRQAMVAAMLALLLDSTARAADPVEQTRELIAVLRSETSLFEKARACQQLGEIGTSEAVPILAGLLADPKLSAYARSGLEGIPDPSAAAALRNAVEKVKGPLLAGVVNSLGVLRDAEAVDLLTRLASDPASGVRKEALLALGNISTPASIQVLDEALTRGPDDTRGDAAAACLLTADRQRANGDLGRAVMLYDLIRSAKVPLACRVGATRGAILARKTDRVPFLMEQLRSGDLAIRNAALLTVREVPDNALADALNAEVARSQPELQGQLLLALADCHNARSVAVIQSLADSRESEIRRTALVVLGRIGPSAAAVLITSLQKDRPADERSVLLNGLRSLEGPDVDDLLLQALTKASTSRLRIDLVRLLNDRAVASAAPEILRQAAANDRAVSIAALSALNTLAGPNELAPLISFTRSCTDPEVKDAAESALAAACLRSGDLAADAVLRELDQATTTSERNCWVRVLARVGYPQALPAIQAAASDANPEVADNALAQLGRWPNPAPMETLLKVLTPGTNSTLSRRAFVSVLDLATSATDEAQTPESAIAGWLRRAAPLAQSTADKRRLLGLLGRLKTAESFRLLAPYLEDPGVRAEAASGIVQIAPALTKGEEAGALKTALEKIALVSTGDLRNRALQLAKSIPAPGLAVSLFDGRSLTGWEGDTNVWRVREGVIVGGSMTGNSRNEFLATTRRYTNFVLRLEYKLVGTEGFVNSGVQFRSVRVSNPPNEMSGYQADIGAGYSGCLYDESRRNTFLSRPADEVVKKLEKPGDWNRYEIRCEGAQIQLWLNGERTVDYTESQANILQEGLIGLQIHGGNKAEVSFRNITIQGQ